MSYKVVIPSAGLGSRIGPYTKFLNKALVTIGDKPAISRVIDKFPKNIEIIILLGYKGEMIKEIIDQLYSDRNITYVFVENYDGEGSGLGHTLEQAESYLQCPFIFIPNDTLIGDDEICLNPDTEGNWAAYYQKIAGDSYNPEIFRTLELSSDNTAITRITGKGTLNNNIYIGLCGVKDYKNFWNSMKVTKDKTIGEVAGLRALEDINPIRIMDWYDCGSLKNLVIAKEKFKNPSHNILEKEDESIWFTDSEALKFSINKKFISDRVKRVKYLPEDLTPELISSGDYSYRYKKVSGNVIARNLDDSMLSDLLDICLDKMWSKTSKISEDEIEQCNYFYKDKTYERLDYYCERFEQVDIEKKINGRDVSSVKDMLDQVNWDELCSNAHWSLFHGDFHGENILYDEENGFSLLDWRQCFGKNSMQYGDAYYDFAKLRHGFLVNHGIVDEGGFEVKEHSMNNVFISINQYSNLIDCEKFFELWLKKQEFDYEKVKLLTALIYINVCGLHEYPYSKFLYLYGQYLLNDCLNVQNES